MLADDLISFHSLHQFTLRIDIVERNLHELNFRVLCQDPVQEFCRGMEGKAQMFDLSFCFPLVCMIKEVRSFYDAALAVNAVIINRLEIMQQIKAAALPRLIPSVSQPCKRGIVPPPQA